MTTAAIELGNSGQPVEQVRLGSLKNGNKPKPLTAEVRQKGVEARKRKRVEAEVRKWEQLEPIALKRLGELLLKADDAVAQRAIADYFDRRPETAKITRQETRSLHVSATLQELEGLGDDELVALSQAPVTSPPALPEHT